MRSVRQGEATTQAHGWASKNKALSFAGTVTLLSASQVSAEGLDAEASPTTPVPAHAGGEPRTAEARTAPRFWHEQIQVEESLRPRLIPILIDQNPCVHWRSPMDMMRQGWSMSLFQASQQ